MKFLHLRFYGFDNEEAVKTQAQNNYFWVLHLKGSSIVFLYGLVCTFGALANLVVLFAFIRTSNLRNLRNSFIVNLACSDLLLCVVTAPVTLYTSANAFWPFGDIACKVVSFFCFPRQTL
ncbi:unnamed protein product [Nippostrongylus brasiliensis]|uniref:Neuropeptide F receptor (inferred by orthology to a D. melanogaster protein) n=1 Tax=Nippostrongylus brasiliensis TaxID=27835 RepID=A0A0N4XI02_NIPBR|nr:unnamed protein product [Nippostrongylus brasiliensis]